MLFLAVKLASQGKNQQFLNNVTNHDRIKLILSEDQGGAIHLHSNKHGHSQIWLVCQGPLLILDYHREGFES